MSSSFAGTHCGRCGVSYQVAPRYPRRCVCRACFRVEERGRSRRRRQEVPTGIRVDRRHAEVGCNAKFEGRDLLLRNRRMAAYAQSVARGEPIEFEPRDEV